VSVLPEEAPRLVEMRGISKRFGGVVALENVDLSADRGEVVALLGDNGAGKSTLMNILSGALRSDRGSISLAGEPARIERPRDAKDLGIETVYQDLALCDNVDVPTNLFLGREIMRRVPGTPIRVFAKRRMTHMTRQFLNQLQIELSDLGVPVRFLSGGQRQSIAIAKAVSNQAKVVILDEPTAALGVAQTENVLSLVKNLRDQGLCIVYISHNMEDVFQVADRMVVLKNGRVVGERQRAETDRDEIARLIITGSGTVNDRTENDG